MWKFSLGQFSMCQNLWYGLKTCSRQWGSLCDFFNSVANRLSFYIMWMEYGTSKVSRTFIWIRHWKWGVRKKAHISHQLTTIVSCWEDSATGAAPSKWDTSHYRHVYKGNGHHWQCVRPCKILVLLRKQQITAGLGMQITTTNKAAFSGVMLLFLVFSSMFVFLSLLIIILKTIF